MARLSDLPNELIILVTNLIRPSDLNNFFLTSKKIREVNASLLPIHKALSSKYKSLLLQNLRASQPNAKTLAGLLKDVLVSPRTAAYVEEIDIQAWFYDWSTRVEDAAAEDKRKDEMRCEATRALFTEGFRNSKYFSTEEATDWTMECDKGGEDPILNLLFLSLPYLSVLDISNVPLSEWGDWLSDTIVDVSQDPKPDALMNLTRVNLSSTDERIPSHLVKAFASLPSLRQLHARHVYASSEDRGASLRSNVTELSLRGCRLGSEQVYDFLSSFQSLATLDFTNIPDNEGDPQPTSILFWIRNALKNNAKNSLKKLKVRARKASVITPMGSLRDFEALEELDTNMAAVLSPDMFGHGKLTDALPPSIKKITLRHPHNIEVERCTSILRDVLDLGARKLPRLEALSFRTYIGISVVLPLRYIAACQAAGITVSSD